MTKLNVEIWASQVVLVLRNPPTNAGDLRAVGSIPGSGRSSEGGHGTPLQFSCLQNPTDRGTWRALVHRVTRVRHIRGDLARTQRKDTIAADFSLRGQKWCLSPAQNQELVRGKDRGRFQQINNQMSEENLQTQWISFPRTGSGVGSWATKELQSFSAPFLQTATET